MTPRSLTNKGLTIMDNIDMKVRRKRLEYLKSLSPEEMALKIKGYRVNNGVSQEELAELVGVPRSSISRWENGSCKITPVMVGVLLDRGVL